MPVVGLSMFQVPKVVKRFSHMTLLEKMERMDELDQQLVDTKRRMDAIRDDANQYNKWWVLNETYSNLLNIKKELGGS